MFKAQSTARCMYSGWDSMLEIETKLLTLGKRRFDAGNEVL